MGVCLDGLCGDERESVLGITKTTTATLTNFRKAFFKALKERGERGVWFKQWFTQENVGSETMIGRGKDNDRTRITNKEVIV